MHSHKLVLAMNLCGEVIQVASDIKVHQRSAGCHPCCWVRVTSVGLNHFVGRFTRIYVIFAMEMVLLTISMNTSTCPSAFGWMGVTCLCSKSDSCAIQH